MVTVSRAKNDHHFLIHCRSKFEKDAAEEIVDQAKNHGGFIPELEILDSALWLTLPEKFSKGVKPLLCRDRLIFSRQVVSYAQRLSDFSGEDRVTPVVQSVHDILEQHQLPLLYRDLVVTHVDSDVGKETNRLCTKLQPLIEKKLRTLEVKRVFTRPELSAIEIAFIDPLSAVVGLLENALSYPWPAGIPRLRQSSGAPSRSALKLDEALMRYGLHRNGDPNGFRTFSSGTTAVDLGAAPGGWTHELVRRGAFVFAVDNARIAENLLETDMVEHLRQDAFTFQPKNPVDWLTCDVVANPYRITDLVCTWMQRRWFQQAIINLKLPMERKYETVKECLARLRAQAQKTRGFEDIWAKQLYHDRDEVTVWVGPL